MDEKLRLLFDYQKFENNPQLNIIIKQCRKNDNKFQQRLTDSELRHVAGGKGFLINQKTKKP